MASMATLVLESVPDTWTELQQVGENTFAAAFFIAFLQAMVALLQYRNNPSGQLVIPPGHTYGTEHPRENHHHVNRVKTNDRTDNHPGNKENNLEDETNEEEDTSWFGALRDLESSFDRHRRKKDERNIKTDSSDLTSISVLQTAAQRYSAMVKRINRSLVLLLPWASNVVQFLIQRNIHLFHLGFIVSLSQVLDIPHRFFSNTTVSQQAQCTDDDNDELSNSKNNNNNNDEFISMITKKPSTPRRLIVIGDSLAVGLGTVNIFDPNKRQGKYRAENFNPQEKSNHDENINNEAGPVFPRVLARVLAERTGQSVQWRSAGVDGGDTKDIEEHCLGVIKEQVEREETPDVVVIMTGINDLKGFASNPIRNPAGPREFRSRLTQLITNIRQYAPKATIVVPALPTQMVRQDSPFNIFPLVFFLNMVVGFWDAQKKLVTQRFHCKDIQYIGMSPNEIYDWYMTDTLEDYGIPAGLDVHGEKDMSLISADGVHPNARCYAHWAASLGKKIQLSAMPPSSSPEGGVRSRTRQDQTGEILPAFIPTLRIHASDVSTTI